MFFVSCNNSSVSKNPKNNTSNPNPNYKPPMGNKKTRCDFVSCNFEKGAELNNEL